LTASSVMFEGWASLTLLALFVYFKMVAIEEFKNNLAAATGFLAAVIYLGYKLKWCDQILEWYSNKIEDKYEIVIPSLLALLFPFIFIYFSTSEL